MKEIQNMTALELSSAIKNGELSVLQVLNFFIERINRYDPILHCFNSVDIELARKTALEVQEGINSGKYTGRLAGIPFAVKDNICARHFPATCSSKMLESFMPPYDATVIEKLKSEGMILVGKLNMDEFAMGSTTETSYTGATKNPWDISRVSGGSSGGSAACVSAKLMPVTLGTDTGGSIRQPCSYCGVSGLKPTYGSVSRYGLIAYASSFDQIGPIVENVDDCAAVYSIICGKDEKDSTSKNVSFDFGKAVTPDIKGKKIGIPKEFIEGKIEQDVKAAVLDAAKLFTRLGAEIELFSMPVLKYAVPTYYIIACAQASSNLSRYDGVKFGYRAEACRTLEELYVKSRSKGFGIEVKRRIMLGNFVLSSGYYDAYYNKALKVCELIKEAFVQAFEKYDIMLAPISPTTAVKEGSSLENPLKMYLGDAFTVPVNLAGLPAYACPCGFDKDNMPIGMQLIGKPFCEVEILSAAKAYEAEASLKDRLTPTNFGGEGV